MTDIRTIITHPGSAHKDEVLACAVLITQHPLPIMRRNPTDEELADPSVAIIDIGHQHEAELNNFDHHQFPREQTPTCSLSLILQNLGLYEDAQKFCDWLETSEWLDCRGPVNTAKMLGTDRNVVSKLNSPIDVTLLKRFASESIIEPDSVIWQFLHMVGSDLINYLQTMRKRIDGLPHIIKIWDIENAGKVIFIERSDDLPDEPMMGLHHFLLEQGIEDKVIAAISPDSRGEGYGLKRYNDHPSLNFSQVENEPDVHFAHRGGFIAKTSATEIPRLKAILEAALIND